MHARIIFITVVLLTLTGCQSVPVNGDRQIPVNSLIHLHKEMTYHPDQVTLYIQDGRMVRPNSIDVYRPHCNLALDRKAYRVTHIIPDTFVVYKVTYDSATASLGIPPSILSVASAAGDNGLSWEVYSTVIYLKSEKQPAVYQLTCEHTDDPQNPRHLSLRQIRDTLGDIMSVEIR